MRKLAFMLIIGILASFFLMGSKAVFAESYLHSSHLVQMSNFEDCGYDISKTAMGNAICTSVCLTATTSSGNASAAFFGPLHFEYAVVNNFNLSIPFPQSKEKTKHSLKEYLGQKRLLAMVKRE